MCFSKAHLDNIIAQSKLEISPTSKPWEPYRAYEKKLSSALNKEKGTYCLNTLANLHSNSYSLGPGRRGRKRKDAKSAEFVTTDEEGGEASEMEGMMVNGNAEKPRRRNPSRRAAQNGGLSEGETGVTEDENDVPASTAAPKARPKPRPVRKRGSPAKRAREESPIRTPSPTPARQSKSLTPLSSAKDSAPPEELEEPEDPEEELQTPKASRKRARSDDEGEDEEMQDATTNGINHDDDAEEAEASQETQTSELKIRRKRVRH